jgi:uncharacterized protein
MEKLNKMKKAFFYLVVLSVLTSCKQEQDVRGFQGPEEVQVRQPDTLQLSLEEQAEDLQEMGYQTFIYGEEEGEKHLMQQYYIVFLKSGKNRSQDSLTTAQLQEQHLAHLNRMATDGYLSLAGPFAGDGDIRGIAVYNTPTREMADSLARLDPMVEAGRLEVEIHPWWAAKGSTLK